MSLTLWQICRDTYFPRRLKIRCEQTRLHYRYSLNSFAQHLGREPEIGDLNDDTVTLWVSAMLTRGENADDPRSVNTALSYVTRVLTLWRWLFHFRAIDSYPMLELPSAPEPVPLALDESQLRRLFESALCRPGFVAGIPARYFWPALLGFVFSTSERKGGALAARREWVSLENHTAVIPAFVRKGRRKTAIYPLWDEVCWLLWRIWLPERDLLFPWDKSEATFYHHYGKILVDAQLPNDRRHKLQCLRVSHNTWHRVMTGQHSPLLMHSSSRTSERHYEDKSKTVMPPQKLFIPWQSPPDPPKAA